MRDHHRPVEMWIFPTKATSSTSRSPLVVYARNVDWFDYWLRGARDPDPAKAAQYKRWDDLRAERPAPQR